MTKMRTFTFYAEGEEPKDVEALGFRRAVKSFQGGSKAKQVRVEWEAKKGGMYEKLQMLPLGRSKKLGK